MSFVYLFMLRVKHVEHKADLNQKDFNGSTPLHYACVNGNPSIVAYLLAHNARITVDKFGIRKLNERFSCVGICCYIIASTITTTTTQIGNTPLHDCSMGGRLECARLLIANGCDIWLKDNQSMSSTDIAESYCHLEYSHELRRIDSDLVSSKTKLMDKTYIHLCWS